MKIIMHTTAAGPAGVLQAGTKPQEVEDKFAQALIKGGYASQADDAAIAKAARKKRHAPQMETATAPGPEETTASIPVETSASASEPAAEASVAE